MLAGVGWRRLVLRWAEAAQHMQVALRVGAWDRMGPVAGTRSGDP